MHRFLRKYLLLLPLMVFVVLPCSAKREFKLLLDIIPGKQLNFNKEETAKYCINNILWAKPAQKDGKNVDVYPTFGFGESYLFIFATQNISADRCADFLPTPFLSVSRVILHRSLII